MQTNWGPESDPSAEPEGQPSELTEEEQRAHEADHEPAEPDLLRSDEGPDRATMVRALRELENAKARVERDAHRAQDEMREQLVVKLFPVLDNVDRTIAAAEQAGDAPTVVEGVRLVRRQFAQLLEGYGVQRIDARGKRFDPNLHEAVSLIPVEDPQYDRVVIDQLEPGYIMGERLLRAAKVVVGQARFH